MVSSEKNEINASFSNISSNKKIIFYITLVDFLLELYI